MAALLAAAGAVAAVSLAARLARFRRAWVYRRDFGAVREAQELLAALGAACAANTPGVGR